MTDLLPQIQENEGVNPTEIEGIDVRYYIMDNLLAYTAPAPQPTPMYQDERFVPGQQQIGLGTCCICRDASNDCFLVSYGQGVPSCGHPICSMCAITILAKEERGRVCPFCRRPVHTFNRAQLQ